METLGKTYLIPAGNYPALLARVADIAKRAARLAKKGELADATPIGLVNLETVIRKGGDCKRCGRPARDAATHDDAFCGGSFLTDAPDAVFYRVGVTGTAPKLAGWEFIGTLQHEEGGTILRTVPTAVIRDGELSAFRNATPECNHCNANRRRNDTFLVRSTHAHFAPADLGKIMQVGRNCLAAFLGGLSPNGAAGMAEYLAAVGDACEASEGSCGSDPTVGTLADFLVYVAASIRMSGWTSRTKAREWGKPATADNAFAVMFPGNSYEAKERAKAFRATITDADRKLAADALTHADAALTAESAATDYEHNLRVVVVGGIVTFRLAGLAGSLIGWYERAMGVVRERARTKDSAHVGMVGKRETFAVTLTTVFSFETAYGVTHLYRFEDTAGNVLVWKSSKDLELEKGTGYCVTGSVKAHDEYKGTKQTVLTRCKVADVEPVVAAVVVH